MSLPATARSLDVTAAGRVGWLRRYALWLGAAALLMALPHVVRTSAAIPVMNQMGIAIVFALSYNML
ncbi:MAG TPA: branched-chain amino acid ABC transporter permease, partial [Methylomirabilota bacterium]|nr:branched-chain amino acid ABC transporter permease [Methylomirabilota bacterium]